MSWNIRMLILNRFLCEFNCFMWAGICFCNKFKKAYTLITIDMKLINFSPNLIFYLTVSCQFVHGTTNHTKTLWPFYPYWSQRLMKLNWNFLQTLPVIIFHQSFNLLGQVKFPKYRNEERKKRTKSIVTATYLELIDGPTSIFKSKPFLQAFSNKSPY